MAKRGSRDSPKEKIEFPTTFLSEIISSQSLGYSLSYYDHHGWELAYPPLMVGKEASLIDYVVLFSVVFKRKKFS